MRLANARPNEIPVFGGERMYVNKQMKYQCSACGYRGEPQRVTTKTSETLRCPYCGHEKLIAIFASASTDDRPYTYTAGDETVIEY
jgi:DNA-directed RNA polymerase subunit RPC12/RpoP